MSGHARPADRALALLTRALEGRPPAEALRLVGRLARLLPYEAVEAAIDVVLQAAERPSLRARQRETLAAAARALEDALGPAEPERSLGFAAPWDARLSEDAAELLRNARPDDQARVLEELVSEISGIGGSLRTRGAGPPARRPREARRKEGDPVEAEAPGPAEETWRRPDRFGAGEDDGDAAEPEPEPELDELEETAPPSPPEAGPPSPGDMGMTAERDQWQRSEPPPQSATGSAPARAEPIVSTGFAGEDGDGIDPDTTLAAGERYWFWLEVGEPARGSIETRPTALPVDLLPAEARLSVVLFSLSDGLALTEGAERGELRVLPDGAVRVARQPGSDGDATRDEIRLRFPVRAPAEGVRTMRCSIYHGQTLVQSRRVRARVTADGRREAGALESTLDYTLSRSLRAGHLSALPDHVLSVLVNRNEDGTHGFFFKGIGEFTGTATLGELELQAVIDRTRGAMRRVAWGSDADWSEGTAYRYQDGAVDLERLRGDLQRLASAGLALHDQVINDLAGGRDRWDELHALMRTPGTVQVAHKESPSHLVPAAMIYDYVDLDTGAPDGAGFALCPRFVASLADPAPLEEAPCFQGRCPSREEPLVVCPSGFWGFRHELGLPVSIGGAPDAPASIGYSGTPGFAMAVYLDFPHRAAHERQLQALMHSWPWEYADTRQEALDLLRTTRSQLVYFYCHGGIADATPYLMVGARGEGIIRRENLRKVRWTEPRPLVFINGCKTVAVSPEQAFDLVSALVENAGAAGVIGTEITVFEELATAFAEEFFRRFLRDRQPLGAAVRGARLALLKRGNPLGLVYVPFALAGLHLVEQPV